MTPAMRTTALVIVLISAAGCSSGGGGGGGSSAVPFSSFQAIAPNQTVVISGMSQTASGTNTGATVDALNFDSLNESNSTVTVGFDSNRNLTLLSIATPQSSVSFSGSEISCVTFAACAAIKSDFSALAATMDPYDLGWNYQSFGVWLKDVTPTTFQAGAISAGAVTPASALPIGLTNANFFGHAGGFYIDSTGKTFITDADMSAVVNFQGQTIGFSTSNTIVTDVSTFTGSSNAGLDLRGNWSYGSGTSQFSGAINTVDLTLQGTATGRFYGPSAEEIGGVYNLGSGTTRSKMIGAFGGRR